MSRFEEWLMAVGVAVLLWALGVTAVILIWIFVICVKTFAS